MICMTFLLMGSVCVWAQSEDDNGRRWAIDGQLGGNMIRNAASTDALVPQYRMGSTSNSGLITKLHMEYYLPKAPFSLKAGYEHEELHFLKGDGSCDLNQLMLGGRWYPAPAQWKVSPYVGVDVLYAFGADRGPFEMTSSMSWSANGLTENTYSYAVEGVAKAPRFSLGPVVGADIYLFSSVALQLEYSYRLGVDAPYRAHYTEGGSGRTTDYHGQMHRHALTVDLKLTFPFLWTCDDGYGLLNGLLDIL